jgi:hypothetical protein
MMQLQSPAVTDNEFSKSLASKIKTENLEQIDFTFNITTNYFSDISSSYAKANFGISSDTAAFENKLFSKLKLDSEKHSSYLKSLMVKEDFVEGETTATELYLIALYKENPVLLEESFQKTWLKLYQLADFNILANFISIVSAIDYEWLKDKADALVLAGCSHCDEYVNEATLRAVEAWEEPSHINYLNTIRPFSMVWLEDYRKEVINHIERMQ